MLDIWGMRITPSLPSLPGQLWPGIVGLDRVLSMSQTEKFGIKTEYLCLIELFEIELF